jgi:hypothetical protein
MHGAGGILWRLELAVDKRFVDDPGGDVPP